jgi:hypothetical protein
MVMADFGSFLGQVGAGIGRVAMVGADINAQNASTELKKQELADRQMQSMMLQQKLAGQKQIGAYLASETAKEGSATQDSVGAARMYGKAEQMALQNGDFDGAQMMANLSKGKLAEAREEQVLHQKQQQDAKEQLSTAAADYDSNPTPEGQRAVVDAAVKAGVNPTQIPPPGTPAFKTWVNQQQMASMNGKERVQFIEKTAEFKQRQQEIRQTHEDNVSLRRAQMAQTAAYQQGMLELRRAAASDKAERAPVVKEFEGGQYEFDPSGKLKGEKLEQDPRWVKIAEPKLTSQQKTGVSKLNSATGEVARSLTNFASMDFDTRTGPFADLKARGPLDALVKMGTNTLTPTQAQAMTVAGGGMGNQIGLAESAFGGRGPVGSQQQHLEDITTPKPGDTGYTAAYKLANGKELMMALIDNAPPAYRNSKDAQRQRDALNKAVPWSTSDVIEQTRRDPKAKKDVKTLKQWSQDSIPIKERIAENVSEGPAAAAGGGGATPGGGVPADISALINKYGSK